MPTYDNPAGRLYELLARLTEQDPNTSIASAWGEVLGVNEGEVALRLGEVGQLVADVQSAAEATDAESGAGDLMPTVLSYRANWWTPMFPSQYGLDSTLSKVLPDADALNALRLVSANLHLSASEGRVPGDDELSELKGRLDEATAAVRNSEALPEPVKHAIADRLMDVQRAIEHIAIGGPAAVSRALDALFGTAFLQTTPKTRDKRAFQKIGAVFILAWTLFNAGPAVERNIEAWGTVPDQITEAAGEWSDFLEGDAIKKERSGAEGIEDAEPAEGVKNGEGADGSSD